SIVFHERVSGLVDRVVTKQVTGEGGRALIRIAEGLESSLTLATSTRESSETSMLGYTVSKEE
ncbi:hypothetical protein J6590_105702, partial [Homalodisca vitripennis]